MNYAILFFTVLFSSFLQAQTSIPKLISSPQYIVVDSKDNVIVHLYRGR
jgi:hypothetical protein